MATTAPTPPTCRITTMQGPAAAGPKSLAARGMVQYADFKRVRISTADGKSIDVRCMRGSRMPDVIKAYSAATLTNDTE